MSETGINSKNFPEESNSNGFSNAEPIKSFLVLYALTGGLYISSKMRIRAIKPQLFYSNSDFDYFELFSISIWKYTVLIKVSAPHGGDPTFVQEVLHI